MKFLGMSFKKETIVYYMEPEDKLWFFDEPSLSKDRLKARIEYLKSKNAKIKIKTRYTIEI